MKDRVALVHVV